MNASQLGKTAASVIYAPWVPELSDEKVNVALTVLQDKGYVERQAQRTQKAQTVQLRTDKSPQDLRLDFTFLKQRQQADYRRLGEMLDYLTTTACRRAVILRYFGERVPVGKNCGQCDLCTQGTQGATSSQTLPAIPGALDSQDVILGAVRDLQKRKMGRSGIAQVLAGSRSRKMKQLKLEESPHYGKLTRLGRAHNLNTTTGRTMSGGIDAAALELPKRLFGAARQLEDGGSLTIIATCLIDTGSRMDEVIAQEFKGTGNMELLLDRRLADRRVFPAINIAASGTRKEEQLLDPDTLNASRLLRRKVADMNTVEATQAVLSVFEKIGSNAALIEQLASAS